MSRPAESPGGFANTDPCSSRPAGARRHRTISARVASHSSGGRVDGELGAGDHVEGRASGVAVAEVELSRAGNARVPLRRRSTTRRPSTASVSRPWPLRSPHGATDAAGIPTRELEASQLAAAAPRQHRQGDGCAGAESRRHQRGRAAEVAGEHQGHAGVSVVGDEEVGAPPPRHRRAMLNTTAASSRRSASGTPAPGPRRARRAGGEPGQLDVEGDRARAKRRERIAHIGDGVGHGPRLGQPLVGHRGRSPAPSVSTRSPARTRRARHTRSAAVGR